MRSRKNIGKKMLASFNKAKSQYCIKFKIFTFLYRFESSIPIRFNKIHNVKNDIFLVRSIIRYKIFNSRTRKVLRTQYTYKTLGEYWFNFVGENEVDKFYIKSNFILHRGMLKILGLRTDPGPQFLSSDSRAEKAEIYRFRRKENPNIWYLAIDVAKTNDFR